MMAKTNYKNLSHLKTTSKKNNTTTCITALYGIFKGRIHYKDDTMFNLGVM